VVLSRGVHSLLYFAYTCVRDLFIWGVIYLVEKIIRWWYFTCKHVSLFQKPSILHVHFYKIYLQWIYWTLFFIARCSTICASDLPEGPLGAKMSMVLVDIMKHKCPTHLNTRTVLRGINLRNSLRLSHVDWVNFDEFQRRHGL
jgi:hypothetical protein